MALTGQTATHSPQPVQAPSLISGRARPPTSNWKRTARASHHSAQTRQVTPAIERQSVLTRALMFQGVLSRTANRDSGQASAQAPQKSQAPREKSTTGYPARPLIRILGGQAGIQSPQPVHRSVKSASGGVQGGLTGAGLPCHAPPKSALRLTLPLTPVIPLSRIDRMIEETHTPMWRMIT